LAPPAGPTGHGCKPAASGGGRRVVAGTGVTTDPPAFSIQSSTSPPGPAAWGRDAACSQLRSARAARAAAPLNAVSSTRARPARVPLSYVPATGSDERELGRRGLRGAGLPQFRQCAGRARAGRAAGAAIPLLAELRPGTAVDRCRWNTRVQLLAGQGPWGQGAADLEVKPHVGLPMECGGRLKGDSGEPATPGLLIGFRIEDAAGRPGTDMSTSAGDAVK